MTIPVREATEEDLVSHLRLRRSLWGEEAGSPESLAEARRMPGHRAWLAWDGRTAIGFAEVSLRTYAEDVPIGPPVPYLEGLYVRPAFRCSGVGRVLVEAVREWARGTGASHLASDAEVRNRRSHAVHRALGFVETSRLVHFASPLR